MPWLLPMSGAAVPCLAVIVAAEDIIRKEAADAFRVPMMHPGRPATAAG
ncbi:MAG: hypothetical protein KIT13_09580 [Burkholderiales bacterium]|nr:hypothetical protein [Burkholderiales bacterium]MCW5605663.1 hypothetical protein [Burkholderiales bacterium]